MTIFPYSWLQRIFGFLKRKKRREPSGPPPPYHPNCRDLVVFDDTVDIRAENTPAKITMKPAIPYGAWGLFQRTDDAPSRHRINAVMYRMHVQKYKKMKREIVDDIIKQNELTHPDDCANVERMIEKAFPIPEYLKQFPPFHDQCRAVMQENGEINYYGCECAPIGNQKVQNDSR